MNNTFNINRFGKLLAFDSRKYLRNFGITLAILCGLNLVLWLLTLIFGFTMPTLPRYLVIYLAVFLGMLLVPSKAFGDINLSREGIRYAMLPVSNLEKFLSYTLFCLLTPVVIIFGGVRRAPYPAAFRRVHALHQELRFEWCPPEFLHGDRRIKRN